MTPKTNEREFREILSKKVSGSSVGMWLLVPGLLRLGAWDIIKAWSNCQNYDISPRVALQKVNESALCVNRVRKKNSLGHQGFQLLNGMGRLASDEQMHLLLDNHTMQQSYEMMLNLGMQRQICGHFDDDIIAIDPHRIPSNSKRIMAKKKKKPNEPSQKMLQTFFSVSAKTGQPIMATISSTGMPTTRATKELIGATNQIIRSPSLLVADKEHFTKELFKEVDTYRNFELLVPALKTQRVKNMIEKLKYKRLSAGFAIAETKFNFEGDKTNYRLIAERLGECQKNHIHNAFLTTSDKPARKLLSENYDKRWSVEEFFRFENEMGLNRASTLNLNIRYASLAFSMIAQAAVYELRKNILGKYIKWDARHLANEILAWNDGDIRVKGDTIIVTFYKPPKYLNKQAFCNLPQQLAKEKINPKIPWLFDYKLDFRFK